MLNLNGEFDEVKVGDFNERLLSEIANLNELAAITGVTSRIEHALEILRFVRNSELDLTYEQGIVQEKNFIEKRGN